MNQKEIRNSTDVTVNLAPSSLMMFKLSCIISAI